MDSANKGERWFHLLSSQSIAFFPTVGNTTWNMLRQASVYTVTRSCKINQRSSGCQQKATPEKNPKHMSPFKRKICFFTATKDWKQILSSNVELCQIPGSQKKALARKELWWVLSYWETAEMGLLWCWRERKVTGDSEKTSLLRQVCIFISFLSCSQQNITMHEKSHLAGESSSKSCSINTHQLQLSESSLCFSSGGFFPREPLNWCKWSILFANFGRKYIMCLKSFLKDEVGEEKSRKFNPIPERS